MLNEFFFKVPAIGFVTILFLVLSIFFYNNLKNRFRLNDMVLLTLFSSLALYSRIQNIFSDTPINSSEEFYAARIMFKTTRYKVNNNYSKKLILTSIIGFIFAIFSVLIFISVKKRV